MTEQAVREAVSALLKRRGVDPISRAWGLSPEALLRLAAGLPVRRGTVAQAEMALASSPQYGEAPHHIP
jgi:hypothetical protein